MSALKLCPTCGSEYPANERFCPRDGTALRAQGGGNDLVGSIIAERYHVIRKLGEGGMGQVYLAEHVKMGRKSAVKVMNPGMVHDADAISRFNREASNASRINHPNVAGIYDFGETADGLIYLAMEYIEGESLTAVVAAAGALPPMRAARITKQAADGLTQADDLGIVHRDLKPDNIMIAKNRDGSDCVKVVDFGIAKAAGSAVQNVTRTGMVVGTPEYMSPEQLAGDRLDGRSDQYSLALVTYNMLTGTLPFPSETAQESMIMRLTHEPSPLAVVRPEIAWPAAVQDVMTRALQRDATLRFPSASAFGDALYEAVDRMPQNAMATAGTLVVDAAAIPRTRLGGAVAPAAAPPARRVRSGMPAVISGGALTVAAVAGGIFLLSKGGGASPSLQRPNAQPVAPPATSASLTGTTGAPSTSGTPGAGSGRPATMPASGSAERIGGTQPVRQVATARQQGSATDIGALLPALLDASSNEVTAGEALATATSLVARATRPEDVVGLGLARAQALAMLGRDSSESCTILHSIQERGKNTRYAADIARLLKFGC